MAGKHAVLMLELWTVAQRFLPDCEEKFYPIFIAEGPVASKGNDHGKEGLAVPDADFSEEVRLEEKPGMDKQQKERWAGIIADTTEKHLNLYSQGNLSNTRFVEDMSDRDPALYFPKNVKEEINLSAAWNFADSFFDAASEGFGDLDGIPWEEAALLIKEVISRLRTGKPIDDPRVLRYA